MSAPVTFNDIFLLMTAEADREAIIVRAAGNPDVRREAERRHQVFDRAAELVRRIIDNPALKEQLRGRR